MSYHMILQRFYWDSSFLCFYLLRNESNDKIKVYRDNPINTNNCTTK